MGQRTDSQADDDLQDDLTDGVQDDAADDLTDDADTSDDAADDDTPAADDADDSAAEGDDEGADAEEGDDEQGEDSGLEITLDGAPVAQDDNKRAPEWLRELRKQNREKDRRLRELEDELRKVRSASQPAEVLTLPPRPKLEDFDYDAEKHDAALEAWYETKANVDKQKAEKERQQEAAKQAWLNTLQGYEKSKSELKAKGVKDFDDAEMAVTSILSEVQQGILVNGAKKAPELVYVLGKNPKIAKDLAAIADPIKFAFEVAHLEAKLKVTPKKGAPPPERRVAGASAGKAAVDKTEERLIAEAQKTGDITKLNNWRREQKRRLRKAA